MGSDDSSYTENKEASLKLRGYAEEIASAVPKLLVSAQTAASSVMAGEHALKRVGHGQNFWQFREYDIHDRPQDIDWRQSAKSDRVFVREKEHQSLQTLVLWADSNEGMRWASQQNLHTKRQIAEIIVLALAVVAVDNGEIFSHISETGKTGRSTRALENFAALLAGQSLGIETNLTFQKLQEARLKRRSIPVLASDFFVPFEDFDQGIARMAERSKTGLIAQILDPAEISLPYTGRVRFFSPDKADAEMVENVAEVRKEYQKRMDAHCNEIQKLTEHYGWHYFKISSDTSLTPIIREMWSVVTENIVNSPRI